MSVRVAYYRGAMGILLVYDVTDERSFGSRSLILNRPSIEVWIDIRNWIRNIEQHASEGVNKILIGNKCDMLDKKVCCFLCMVFILSSWIDRADRWLARNKDKP